MGYLKILRSKNQSIKQIKENYRHLDDIKKAISHLNNQITPIEPLLNYYEYRFEDFDNIDKKIISFLEETQTIKKEDFESIEQIYTKLNEVEENIEKLKIVIQKKQELQKIYYDGRWKYMSELKKTADGNFKCWLNLYHSQSVNELEKKKEKGREKLKNNTSKTIFESIKDHINGL